MIFEGVRRGFMTVSMRNSVQSKIWQIIILTALVAAMASPAILYAQETLTHPKIGLVLSGGGARGAAHVGVLRVLEELHVPIYCIVGTSMGSIVGGLYSTGMPLDELEQIAVKTDWEGLFSDKIPRQVVNYRDKPTWPYYITSIGFDFEKGIKIPQGLVAGKRLDLMLRSLTLNVPKDFNDFPIPFRAIASDIETGNSVVLSKGDLARSLRASMAIPGAFAPVEIDGKLLVDGGVTNNMAVDVAKQMGADVVIAVNIGTPLSTREQLESFLGIVDQITNILTNRNVEAQIKILGPHDTLLTPELGTVTTASFEKMGEAIQIGEKTAHDAEDTLNRYSVSEEEYRSIRAQQLGKVRPVGAIEFVKMDQKSVRGTGFFLNLVTKSADNVLKKDVLAYNIFELYKRGDFEDVDFDLIEENGKQGLLIKAKEQKETAHTLELGLELASTFQRDNSWRILARYQASRLNRLGAQWRNEFWLGQRNRFFTEFYQPLNPYTWHLFIAPSFEYMNYPVDLYLNSTDTNALAQYRVTRTNAGMDLGMQFGEYGEARFGYLRGTAKSHLQTGIPQLPNQENDNGVYKVALKFDQLDSPFIPRQGSLLSAGYLYGREHLGSDEDYESVATTIVKPFSYGDHTILLRGRWDTNFDSTKSLSRGFFLGGLFNLSGLNQDQIFGNTVALGEVLYFARVLKLSKLVGSAMYVGASFEAGNAWLKRSDISSQDLIYAGSIFVAIDSNIGPIYLGFGHAEGGMNALYFSLGARPI
jgi:NTE family protein